MFLEPKEGTSTEEPVEKIEPVIEPNKPNYVYVNTAEEDSMVVQFVLACRRGKRELIPDPPPQPVEEIKKEELEISDGTKESDTPLTEEESKPIEDGETEVKTEIKSDENKESEESEENKEPENDSEEKADEVIEESKTSENVEKPENEVEKVENEVAEIEKPSEEEQPMETEESSIQPDAENKTEVDTGVEKEIEKEIEIEKEVENEIDESKMEVEVEEEKEKVSTEPIEEATKIEAELEKEPAKDDSEEKETIESEKSEEQPMETDSAESKAEIKAETSEEQEESSASDVKEEPEVKDEEKTDDMAEKPEPVFIEVDEYYVKYRNFSYLHCEWRTEEELLKGDRRVGAKIRRFQVKQTQQMNIFENLEDEPFNPDFVETDRVLDMSVHEDPATGKKSRNFLVKWKSLPYEDCTWELEDDVEEKKIEEYLRFNKVPPKDKWKPKRRPSPEMWKKLDESPIYKNNNSLRPYQLEGLNWLKFSWYNSHNCILADEMGLGKTVSLKCFVIKRKPLKKIA